MYGILGSGRAGFRLRGFNSFRVQISGALVHEAGMTATEELSLDLRVFGVCPPPTSLTKYTRKDSKTLFESINIRGLNNYS